MSKDIGEFNNLPEDVLDDIASFMQAGLDQDDAETLAFNCDTPEMREAAKYVYRVSPPVQPVPADSILRRTNPVYKRAVKEMHSHYLNPANNHNS